MSNYLEGLETNEKVSIKQIGTSLSGLDIMAVHIVSRKHHKAH